MLENVNEFPENLALKSHQAKRQAVVASSPTDVFAFYVFPLHVETTGSFLKAKEGN